MTVVAVIATMDEPNVGPLIEVLLRRYVDKVIVVDDSRTSETANAALEAGAVVVRGTNQGLGRAQRRGWQTALGFGATHVVQMDAGGSHDPMHLTRMFYEQADIVIGSRFIPGGHYTGRLWRDAASRIYARQMNLRHRERIRDWTSGYRVFTAEAVIALMQFPYRCRQHGWQAEALLRARDAGLTIREVPIRYQAGDSSLRLKHVWEAVTVR